jgi:hypothetical protein
MSETEPWIITIEMLENPLFSRISLTLAFVDKSCKNSYITGKEEDILQTFLNKLKKRIFQRLCGFTLRAEFYLLRDQNGQEWDKDNDPFRPTVQRATSLEPNRFLCKIPLFQVITRTLKELAWLYGQECSFIELSEEFYLLSPVN